KTPSPVAGRGPGNVHAALAAGSHHVLQGEEYGVSDRGHDGADHDPIDVAPVSVQVAPREFHLPLDVLQGSSAVCPGGAGPPADDGVVVVRTGVGDEVMRVVVRLERRSLRIVAEGKLQ